MEIKVTGKADEFFRRALDKKENVILQSGDRGFSLVPQQAFEDHEARETTYLCEVREFFFVPKQDELEQILRR